MIVDAFMPTVAGTRVLSVTATSQQIVLPAGACIEINNPSATVTLFFEQDPASNAPVANTTTSYPVPPNQCKIIRRQDGVTVLAYIASAAGPTSAYISTGEGV